MIEQMQSQMGQARERAREGAAVQEPKAQRKSA
jgi:hypothetical protein